MTDNEMLALLQDYFDGSIPDAHEVVRQTGLPLDRAERVAAAVARLMAMKLS